MANKKIALVIDDDQGFLEELSDILASDYQIKNLNSMKQASRFIRKNSNITIALVDINLEGDSDKLGLNLLHSLKSKNIPAIAVTAVLDARIIRDAFVYGGAKYLWFKQFDGKIELQDAIKKITDQPKHSAQRKKDVSTGLLPFTIALIGIPITIFSLLLIMTLLIPGDLFKLTVTAGIILVILLIVSLALFIKRITGEQFTTLFTEILKSRDKSLV